MNSRRLWNLAPKAKFLRAKASRDIFLVSEMSRAFHNIIGFEHFTDLILFKYAFNVIQNWETDALQFYLMVLTFC